MEPVNDEHLVDPPAERDLPRHDVSADIDFADLEAMCEGALEDNKHVGREVVTAWEVTGVKVRDGYIRVYFSAADTESICGCRGGKRCRKCYEGD